jgi:hypothetical protein
MWDYNTGRLRRGSLVLWLAFLGNLLFVAVASAPSGPAIVRIEADWELVMGTPDPATSSPQIVSAISPMGDINGLYAVFELNQQSLPSFSPGGMQLQLWEGELPLAESNHASGFLVEEEGETITWTQIMQLYGGQLWFAVRNGKSTTAVSISRSP